MVFVDEPQIVGQYAEDGIIDIVQLHGHEDETYINNLRYRTGAEIIKAFSISSKEDIIKANACSVDYALLDHGGRRNRQTILTGVFRRHGTPLFSGGRIEAGKRGRCREDCPSIRVGYQRRSRD